MKPFPFLFSTSLALTSFAFATDTAVQLSRIDVTADRAPSLTVPSLLDARLDLSLVPGGIELVDAERFLRGRASTLEDTFFLSPGVIAQSRFGSDEARLSIRGSGLQRTFHGRGLRILQDGIPINLADGSFDMQALEPLSAAHINVWRGANALALGASTLGGAIDYVSRTGRHAPPSFARIEAGSFDYLRAGVGTGGVRGDADAYASFTHQFQHGFRAHSRQSNQRLFANAGIRHSATAETRLYLTAVRTDSELPGSLTLAQVRSDPRPANPSNIALDQHRDFDFLRLAAKTSVHTGSTTWDFSAAWSYKDLDHPIGQVVDQLSNDVLLSVTATHLADLADCPYRLRAGFLVHCGRINAANFLNTAGQRGPLISSATQRAENLETFVENQLVLGRGFTLVAAASASLNQRRSDTVLGSLPGYSLRYSRFMPKLGVRFDTRDVQLYANISASYEPPSFSESLTLNTPRRAQTATTFELGARGVRGPFRWDASLYHAALEHEFLSLDHDGNPATPAATVNARDTVHAGTELAVEIDLLGAPFDAVTTPPQRLVLRTAWTHGRFRFHDDPVYADNTLAGLPAHQLRGELTWETAAGWYAGPTFEWSPEKTYIDFTNTFAAPAYALLGLRAGFRSPRGFSCFAELRNLTDRRYVATTGVIENASGTDQTQFLPGSPRALYAGVEYRW